MRAAGLLAVAALALWPRAARARVQNDVQAQAGVVGEGGGGAAWSRTRLDLGLRFESLWGRESPRDFGVGPYLEARTASFAHGEVGGGLMALLPVHEAFPLWVGGGGFGRRQDGEWGSGWNAFVGWGLRPFNYHGSYGLAAGLLADARVHRGPHKGFDLVLSATFDVQSLSYPLLYLVSALRH